MNILTVIPAKNEEATVGEVVKDALSALSGDVVVVDDCSTDATVAAAGDAGAKTLSLPMPLGAWGAIQTGIRYGLRHGYEIVLTMDADGQHHATCLSSILSPVLDGRSDVVIGAYPERGSPQRRLTWRFFRAVTGLEIDDLTSGFRAYNRKAMSVLCSGDAILLDYQDIGVLLLLKQAGLRILEVEVSMSMRMSGHSRVFRSWFDVFRYLLCSGVISLSRRNYTVNNK